MDTLYELFKFVHIISFVFMSIPLFNLIVVNELALMGLLSYVHLSRQPAIESGMAEVKPDGPIPENFAAQLKPFRVRRKRLATVCLFIVITTIILGVQVYGAFLTLVTIRLAALAALFAWRATKTVAGVG